MVAAGPNRGLELCVSRVPADTLLSNAANLIRRALGTVVRTVLRGQGTSEVLDVHSCRRKYLAGEAAQL